jgi:hypothetical protein
VRRRDVVCSRTAADGEDEYGIRPRAVQPYMDREESILCMLIRTAVGSEDLRSKQDTSVQLYGSQYEYSHSDVLCPLPRGTACPAWTFDPATHTRRARSPRASSWRGCRTSWPPSPHEPLKLGFRERRRRNIQGRRAGRGSLSVHASAVAGAGLDR